MNKSKLWHECNFLERLERRWYHLWSWKLRYYMISIEDAIFHNRNYAHYWTHDNCTRQFKDESLLDKHMNQTYLRNTDAQKGNGDNIVF
jgi:hypothetical protein